MLVLSRKRGEQLVIRLGDEIVLVRLIEAGRDRARLGIIAPQSVTVHREEVARRIEDWDEALDEMLAGTAPQAAGIS